jgi:hypothetical protein
MPPPTPLPFPWTESVASEKLHDGAARVELAAEKSSNAEGSSEGRCMVVVLGKNEVNASRWKCSAVEFVDRTLFERTSGTRKLNLFGDLTSPLQMGFFVWVSTSIEG